MNKKIRDSKYYQDWLVKAKRDSETAFLNHRYGGYTDTTCYFCHQTAEKSLKSYLLFKGIKIFPKTHLLPILLSLCQKTDSVFIILKDKCEILNKYYLETKYPLGSPIDYTKEEADKALELAEEILEFVEGKMSKS